MLNVGINVNYMWTDNEFMNENIDIKCKMWYKVTSTKLVLLEEEDMNKDNALKKAKEEYNKIVADEHERTLIKLREKYILDQNTLKQESYEAGRKEEKTEIAKKMLESGASIKFIMEITQLSKEEIEKLRQKA